MIFIGEHEKMLFGERELFFGSSSCGGVAGSFAARTLTTSCVITMLSAEDGWPCLALLPQTGTSGLLLVPPAIHSSLPSTWVIDSCSGFDTSRLRTWGESGRFARWRTRLAKAVEHSRLVSQDDLILFQFMTLVGDAYFPLYNGVRLVRTHFHMKGRLV